MISARDAILRNLIRLRYRQRPCGRSSTFFEFLWRRFRTFPSLRSLLYAAIVWGWELQLCVYPIWLLRLTIQKSDSPKPKSEFLHLLPQSRRSEERREGKEWASRCKSRWSADHLK